MDAPLHFDVADGIGHLVFNRPQQLNAIDLGLARALGAFGASFPRRDFRVLLLSGAGNAFMAGGDINAFRGPVDEARRIVGEIISNLHVFVLALHAMPQTSIALVQGPAAGAGFSLAIGTDMTIAADTAKFASAYLKLGTTPDGGGTYNLPRLVGPKAAHEIFVEGRTIGADEALRLGLVNRVVPADGLIEAGRSLAGRIAAGPGHALGAVKHLLRRGEYETLKAHLEAEKASFLDCIGTPDFAEGVTAFAERRSARFA